MNYLTQLKGLECYAYHGLYQEEQVLGAKFFVDVSVEFEISKPITSIDETTNYEIILQTVNKEMGNRQDLIETVAQNIYSALKNEFQGAKYIEVTIHKPNPAGVFKSGVASVTLRL